MRKFVLLPLAAMLGLAASHDADAQPVGPALVDQLYTLTEPCRDLGRPRRVVGRDAPGAEEQVAAMLSWMLQLDSPLCRDLPDRAAARIDILIGTPERPDVPLAFLALGWRSAAEGRGRTFNPQLAERYGRILWLLSDEPPSWPEWTEALQRQWLSRPEQIALLEAYLAGSGTGRQRQARMLAELRLRRDLPGYDPRRAAELFGRAGDRARQAELLADSAPVPADDRSGATATERPALRDAPAQQPSLAAPSPPPPPETPVQHAQRDAPAQQIRREPVTQQTQADPPVQPPLREAPVQQEQRDAPAAATRLDPVSEQAQARAPVQPAQREAPVQQAQRDEPAQQTRQEPVTERAQADAPVPPAQREVQVQQAQRDAPPALQTRRDPAVLQPARDEPIQPGQPAAPVQQARRDPPPEPTQQAAPVRQTQRDAPLPPAQREAPVQQAQSDTPAPPTVRDSVFQPTQLQVGQRAAESAQTEQERVDALRMLFAASLEGGSESCTALTAQLGRVRASTFAALTRDDLDRIERALRSESSGITLNPGGRALRPVLTRGLLDSDGRLVLAQIVSSSGSTAADHAVLAGWSRLTGRLVLSPRSRGVAWVPLPPSFPAGEVAATERPAARLACL